MPIGTVIIPYSKKFGEFNEKNLVRDLMEDSEKKIVFDEKREIHCSGNMVEATLKNPSIYRAALIQDYMKDRKLDRISHKSRSHQLIVSPGGQTSFDYAYKGDYLVESAGIAHSSFRFSWQARKMLKEWSRIASNLGLEPIAPKKIDMTEKDKCPAIKLCTKYASMDGDKIRDYTTGVLLQNMNDPKSTLSISTIGSSLTINPKGLFNPESIEMIIQPKTSKDIKFAYKMLGSPTKEPYVVYRDYVDTTWSKTKDKLSELKGPGRTAFKYLCAPTFLGAVAYLTSENPRRAGETALIVGAGVATAKIAYEARAAYRERKDRIKLEKTRANDYFGEFASEQERFPEKVGACVLISTKKCVMKAYKESGAK
jgi:hypothetical protein